MKFFIMYRRFIIIRKCKRISTCQRINFFIIIEYAPIYVVSSKGTTPTSPIEILTKAKPKKKKWVLIGILLVLFLSIGAGTIIGYFVGVKYQTTQGTKASVLPCTLISKEYIVDEMYGYTLLLQYATPVKYEEAQLEEYACILFQEWSENKEIEEGVNFISLSFRLDNETTPYYVWGKMITP